jgi:hypothetical protein
MGIYKEETLMNYWCFLGLLVAVIDVYFYFTVSQYDRVSRWVYKLPLGGFVARVVHGKKS